MTAYHFAITTIETGLVLGHAVACPEARYLTVRWPQALRLDRRHLPADAWPALLADAERGLDEGILPAESPLATAVCPRDQMGRANVRFVNTVTLPSAGVPKALDAYLWAQV